MNNYAKLSEAEKLCYRAHLACARLNAELGNLQYWANCSGYTDDLLPEALQDAEDELIKLEAAISKLFKKLGYTRTN